MRFANEYYSRLSKAQKLWYAVGVAVSVVIVTAGYAVEQGDGEQSKGRFSTAQSIGQIAPSLGVTGKALARELGLPLDAPKKKHLRSLGISQDKLDAVAKHLESHEPSNLAYFIYVALVLFGLLYMCRLGRPDDSEASERKYWYNRTPYVVALLTAIVLAGFVTGKSPNPMEGVVKVFKAMVGLYPSVWEKSLGLAFFLGLAIVGNKLVCGWVCPFGAIQELAYSVPIMRKLKRRKLPFVISNAIRVTLFLTTLALLFGVVGNNRGYVVYHGLNPFNLFDHDFEQASIIITVLASVTLAFVVYRPFCHLICPFGLISWIAERISLARVRIDPTKCTKCGACASACPSQAALARIQQKSLPPDCFSCARCLNVCPVDAVQYSFPKHSKPERVTGGARPGADALRCDERK